MVVWRQLAADRPSGRLTTTSGMMDGDKHSQKCCVGLYVGLRWLAASPSPLCSTFQPSGSYLYWLRTGRIAEDSWWNSDTHRWAARKDGDHCSKDRGKDRIKYVRRQEWGVEGFCVHIPRTGGALEGVGVKKRPEVAVVKVNDLVKLLNVPSVCWVCTVSQKSCGFFLP